jgi:chromatin segregation and condensation protein Rec8/ScpA/Scc1 (kleisin family)
VLVAFLAVLVLVRRRVVEAEQSGLFGEITLRRVAPASVALVPASPGGAIDE